MLRQVRATVLRHNMIPPGARVIAAVSGGPDSVCLLHVLREIAPESLVGIAHFNHCLRGAESDEDARFVSEIARELGLPLHLRTAQPEPGNVEQSARRARKRFFRDLLALGAGDRIAIGHTRDDQAETVLFRLLRGSGPSGLAGILPVTEEGSIRPLLDVRREEVRTFLREQGIAWRQDSSNESARFARNRIRNSLLPQLQREWNPGLTDALAHMADLAYEEEREWAQEVAGYATMLVAEGGAVELCTVRLSGLPLAIRRRLLREAIRQAKGNLRQIEFEHVETVLRLTDAPGSGRASLPGLTAIRSFDRLRLERPGPSFASAVPIHAWGAVAWPTRKPLIRIEIYSEAQPPVPCDTLSLELRGWRAGDRYQPAGRHEAVKVKDLFQQTRVPSWQRPSWPIVTSKGKILWVKDFGLSADAGPLRVQEFPLSG